MDTITFVIDNEYFNLSLQSIPEGSLLHIIITTTLNVRKDENGCYILNCEKEHFIPIYEYLKNGKIPSYDELISFNYACIDLDHSYELASVIEEDMRTNMYNDDFKEFYLDNHHGLIKIPEGYWSNFKVNKSNDKNLLFNTKTLVKSEWSVIKDKLAELKKFTDIKGVFVAGGSIFSILFNLPINDIDLFLYGVTEDETFDIINKISNLLIKKDFNDPIYLEKVNKILELWKNLDFYETIAQAQIDIKKDYFIDEFNKFTESIKRKLLNGCLYFSDLIEFNRNTVTTFCDREQYVVIYNLLYELIIVTTECTRTNNAITFKNENSEIQIILRLYQTPSEVLHGFDVDSCCLGFDGNDIWMTQRACFAIKNGYNTVNFNRLSPSYELRLAKYGCRGMAIKINNFDINNVNKNTLSEYFSEIKNNRTTRFYINHAHLSKLHNIDKLLYLDYYCEHYNYKSHSINMINKLNHEKSDYAAPSFIDYKEYANGSIISYLMSHFYPVYIDALSFDANNDVDGPVDFTNREREEEHHNLNSKSKFLKSEVNNTLNLQTNSIHNKFCFIKGNLSYLNLIINIPDLIYDALKLVQPWDFPAKLKFKTTNPGEQMTNTFHQIILEDNSQWYKGNFYKSI
jgi:hypothetical protein